MTKDFDIENWAKLPDRPELPKASSYKIRLWDGDGFDEKRRLSDATPTPEQILGAFDRKPVSDYILLSLEDGILCELPFGKAVDIGQRRAERFFAFKADRTFKFSLDEQRMSWGARSITASLLRKIGKIKTKHQLVLERKDTADLVLEEDSIIQLDDAGLERIYSRKASWKLKVQDVLLTIATPTITVKEALLKAGINPNDGWTIALKLKGAPREAIGLDGVIDLTRKGIEKLWLRPNQIQNGDATGHSERAFALRPTDDQYIDNSDLSIETIIDGSRRWAILRGYKVPEGYTVSETDIAIEIPPTYPAAQLDMFYCFPHLALTSGAQIPQTQGRQSIQGISYQRWSRHRYGQTQWNPTTDSIITHIAIIEDAIAREVGL